MRHIREMIVGTIDGTWYYRYEEQATHLHQAIIQVVNSWKLWNCTSCGIRCRLPWYEL